MHEITTWRDVFCPLHLLNAYRYFQSLKLVCRNLIEIDDVNVNLRDKWDSTPLYYACLCGHTDLVQYLLQNGARCDANTFDGERCQYGALTDQIRNILRNFKINTIRLDQFDFFLERVYELGTFSDVTFDIKGAQFKAHKIVLSARCRYFKSKFENQWKNKSYILASHELVKLFLGLAGFFLLCTLHRACSKVHNGGFISKNLTYIFKNYYVYILIT